MMGLVAAPHSTEYLQSLRFRRLLHCYWLESPLKRAVLLDEAAIFLGGGGSYKTYLATG